MSAARRVVEIELKADRFTGPARQAQNDFQQLENRGTQSLKPIEQSSRQAMSGLQTMGNHGTVTMNNPNSSAQHLRHSAWRRVVIPIATRKSSCKTLTSIYWNRSQIVKKTVYSMKGLIP